MERETYTHQTEETILVVCASMARLSSGAAAEEAMEPQTPRSLRSGCAPPLSTAAAMPALWPRHLILYVSPKQSPEDTSSLLKA